MRQYPFADNRRNRLLFGAFLTALLYLCRDTLTTTCVLGFNRSQLLMAGLLCLVGALFCIRNHRDWKEILTDRRMLVLLLSATVILLPMIGKRDWQMMYFSVLICLFAAVFFSYFTTAEKAAKYYVVILAAVGLYSLLATYVLRRLPDNGLLAVPTFVNSEGVVFYNFGLSYVSVSYDKNRNFGIFREPGVYQYFIMLALVLNNYIAIWEKQRHMWILNGLLAVMMLSTLATGGYAEMAIFAVILFFDKKLYRNKLAAIAAVSLIAAAVGIVVWAYLKQNMLWWEIYAMTVCKFTEDSTSASDRMNSILINLRYFRSNPLFGGTISEVLHAIEHNTSSTTLMFAMFGLLGGSLHVAGWVALVRKQKLWVGISLLLVLFMAFNTQNLIADLFLWLLPMMALTEWTGSLHRKEKR